MEDTETEGNPRNDIETPNIDNSSSSFLKQSIELRPLPTRTSLAPGPQWTPT